MKWLNFVCMGVFCLPMLAQATVSASVNQTQVGPTDMLELTLQKEGRSRSDANLTPLKQDFEILGTSQGSSIQIVNGSMSSTATLRLQLSPKRSGKLQVPAITWDGESTQPIAIVVSNQFTPKQNETSPNQSTNAAGSEHTFFESHLDDQPLYYGGAKLLTLRLYTDQPLMQLSLDFPASSDIKLQQLGDDHQGSEIKNGQRYQYIERQYSLTPQKSGNLTIQGPMLNAQIADNSRGFTSNDPFIANFMANSPLANMMEMRPIRLQAKAIALNVKAKPVSISTQDWLPARNLQFSAKWDPDDGEVNAGEPINLKLHVQAEGINATQLPDLYAKLKLPDNIKAYPDQAKIETKHVDGKLIAVMDQDVALIAQSAGVINIPKITFPWWNTLTNTQEQAVMMAKSLRVAVAKGENSAQVQPPQAVGASSTKANTKINNQAINIEKNASTLLGLGKMNQAVIWALLLLLVASLVFFSWSFFRKSQKKLSVDKRNGAENAHGEFGRDENKGNLPLSEKTISKQAALKNLQSALKDQNLGLARLALLNWAKVIWPQQAPNGLIALANKVEDADLKSAILALNRAEFSQTAESSKTLPDKELIGKVLMQAIKRWKKADEKSLLKTPIAELYP